MARIGRDDAARARGRGAWRSVAAAVATAAGAAWLTWVVVAPDPAPPVEDNASAELDASARVYWDWDEYSCYVVAEGLPAVEGSLSYALWLYTDEDELLLAGRFPGSGSTPASFFAMLPKDMGHVVRAVVTLEPEPAGEAPTGAALLAGGRGDSVGQPPPKG
jgi:hypothetical protein